MVLPRRPMLPLMRLAVVAVVTVGLALPTAARRSKRMSWRLRTLKNFRDSGALAGLPTGRIYRSDDPRYRPFRSCRALQRAGIKTIVKLNGYQSRMRFGFQPFWRRGPCRIRELVVSLPHGRTQGSLGMNIYQIGRRTLTKRRLRVVRHMERQLGLMLKELTRLKEQHLPLLFQCSLGRDRTGIVIALLQRIAGADREAVIREYVESHRTVGRTSATSIRPVLRRTHPTHRFLRKVLGLSWWQIHRLKWLVRGSQTRADQAPVPPARTTPHRRIGLRSPAPRR
ncbi:MAG: tyrosine-protein phosphatase [bacterium]